MSLYPVVCHTSPCLLAKSSVGSECSPASEVESPSQGVSRWKGDHGIGSGNVSSLRKDKSGYFSSSSFEFVCFVFFFILFMETSSPEVAWANLNLRSFSLSLPSAGTTDSASLCFETKLWLGSGFIYGNTVFSWGVGKITTSPLRLSTAAV